MSELLVKLRKKFRRIIFPTDEILAIFKDKTFDSALDVGAGTGMFLELLESQQLISGGQGVEVESKYFRRISENVEITQFSDVKGKFDLLIFNDVLHHVDDKQKMLNQYIGGFLDNWGYVLVKDMNPKNIFFKYFNRLHDLLFAGELINEVAPEELEAMLPEALKKIEFGTKRIFMYDHYFVLYQLRKEA